MGKRVQREYQWIHSAILPRVHRFHHDLGRRNRYTEQKINRHKSLGKYLLKQINPGDLVVRDMGYFVTDSFKLIGEMSAFWLTRVLVHVAIIFSSGSSLEKRPKSLFNNFIAEEGLVRTCGMRARLGAVRAYKKTATQRRRARNAMSKGRASYLTLVRDGWHILLTYVSSDVTAKELFEV